MKQGLGHLFLTSSSSHLFNITDTEQYNFNHLKTDVGCFNSYMNKRRLTNKQHANAGEKQSADDYSRPIHTQRELEGGVRGRKVAIK